MTKQSDKHLDAWLDSYQVTPSTRQLSRIEELIMEDITTLQPDLFTLPTFKECLGAFSAVSALTVVLVIMSSLQAQTMSADFSTLIMTNGILDWSY